MISSRILPVSFFTAVLVFLASCGGGGEKKSTEPASDSTAATAATPATEAVAPSTIITTPQSMMLVKHKVSNFAKFKTSYDLHDSLRLTNGLHSYVIGRSVADSNTVFVAVKADDMAKAKAFANSPGLKQAMQKSGVTGKPSMAFVTVTFQDTAVINSTIRSITTYAVKDWNTWETAFKEGKQERLDNGITDRAYGHDADNNNKVTVVTAVLDTAKASAYWKSDMLKKRRAAGGVIGEPERFVFRVVQRY